MLQHTGITVAIKHAPIAMITDKSLRSEFVNFTNRISPEMTAINIQVPIQKKVAAPPLNKETFGAF
ncbi:MAG: hypothetical protein DRH24_19410 [Deltaproteobacteria bacterium]|nr:MAG: hypothetical protein DRH24_19410 [Deltaproteobacteria bacterium]